MFTFKTLKKTDLPLLFRWLALPHVAQWWRESRDYEKFEKKYTHWIEINDVGPYLIYHNAKPIGYISWYDAQKCPIRNEEFPIPTFGIDLFIADLDYLGKGYGTNIIKEFINEIIMPMNPAKIITDPEITNKRAIHVYEKVGFKKTKVVETTDGTQMVTAQLLEMAV